MNRFQTDSKKNFVNFKSTEYDELWKATQATQDAAEKAADYKKLQTILADDLLPPFLSPYFHIGIKIDACELLRYKVTLAS